MSKQAHECAMRDLIRCVENGGPPRREGAGFGMLPLLEAELAMDKAARLARAKADGFDTSTVYYHGTGTSFDRFSAKFHGSTMGAHHREPFAVWLTSDPEVAGVYANQEPSDFWHEEKGQAMPSMRSANLMPVYVRLRDPNVHDCSDYNHYGLLRAKGWLLSRAKEHGADGVILRNAEDGSDHRSTLIAVFNPKNVRSVFANFDPAARRTAALSS